MVARLLIVTLLLAGSPVLAAADGGPEPGHECLLAKLEGKFLVTVGDSLGYGFDRATFLQVQGTAFVPDDVFPGVEAALAQRIRQRGIHIDTMNFSCPGDASSSFVAGPCAWHANGSPLHDGLHYTGSQLDAVVAFAEQNPGRIGAISMWVGGNDVGRFITACRASHPEDPVSCIRANREAMIDTAIANLALTMQRLRAAAPQAEVVFHLYPGGLEALGYPAATETLLALSARVGVFMAAQGAHVVDLYVPFNRSAQTVCQYTHVCDSLVDVHFSEAGNELAARLDDKALRQSCPTP